ncbi:short transient receptor potential channel 4-like [Glandiceps talaboti]
MDATSNSGNHLDNSVKALVYFVHVPAEAMKKKAHTPAEVLYLTAVERGDKKAVLVALENSDNLNINCVDNDGRSALLIAIQNGNSDLVKVLLDKGLDIDDSLLHAVDVQSSHAVQLICESLKHRGQIQEGLNCRDSKGELHPDITPVVLAGHHNNYDILKILLEYGCHVDDPDNYEHQTAEFTLEYSVGRINVYRALASQAYISLTSDDPITTAFELSWKMRLLSDRDYEFHYQYTELADQCEQFAADLLGQVRDTREQTIVLSHDLAEWMTSRNINEPYKVKTAIRLDQKKFIAHPHCQQHLIERWYRGLPTWRKMNVLHTYTISFFLGFAFPILNLCHILAPGTKIARLLKIPYVRFISQFASSLAFLILLAFQALDLGVVGLTHTSSKVKLNSSTESVEAQHVTIEVKGQHIVSTEILIMFFVFCYTWSEIQDIMKFGKKGVKDNIKWKILDYVMLSLYWAWIAIRIVATFQDHDNSQTSGISEMVDNSTVGAYEYDMSTDQSVSVYPDIYDYINPNTKDSNSELHQSDMERRLTEILNAKFQEIEEKLEEMQSTDASSNRRFRRAARRLPKRPGTSGSGIAVNGTGSDSPLAMLHALHPILVADGIFALAKVISFLRVIRLTVVHLQVGPMQISLGRMTYDIVRFLSIFTLVWFAFSVGLNQLYFHYGESDIPPCELANSGRQCKPPYQTLVQATLTLFWTLFGLSDLSSLKIIGMDHWFTEMVGQTLYALYHVIAIVVLLNILIAMMSNTYTQIEQDADIEWKYSRSRLWLRYYDKSSALAPPFNMFPTWDTFRKIVRLVKRKFNGNTNMRKKRKKTLIIQKDKEYRELVQQLVQRYFFQKKRVGDDEDQRQDQWLSQIKLDVSNLKFDMLQSLTNMDSRMTDIQGQIDREPAKPHPYPGSEIEHALRGVIDETPDPSPLTQQTLLDIGLINKPLNYADRYDDGDVDYCTDDENTV